MSVSDKLIKTCIYLCVVHHITESKVKYVFIILVSILSISCNSQERKFKTTEIDSSNKQKESFQIGQYVTGIFEDSEENLWIGTIEKGIAKYNGNFLRYYTIKDGLPSK